MTKQDYLTIRNDPQGDMMLLCFYHFNKRSNRELQFNDFVTTFGLWILRGQGAFIYPSIITKVLGDLDNEFNITE